MKQKIFYLLGLLSIVTLFIHSCRNDYLQEQSSTNAEQNSMLRSKIIKLSESPHKNKLISELSEAKKILKKQTSKNALGKIVNYGDSISINTDHVIYIENGNYHTYTFNIQRANQQPNTSIENLLLTPLPDGTYREFLVSYSLTQQEKENIENGYYFYSGNNTMITELASGTFSGNGLLAKTICGWKTETIWIPCSGQNHHDGSNYQDCPIYNNLELGTPPTAYTITYYNCVEEQDTSIYPSDGGSGGGDSGGGVIGSSGTVENPCSSCPDNGETSPIDCVTISSDLQNQSSVLTDENGCAIGTPTLPNLIAPPNSPCGKVKAQFAKEKYKKKKDSINNNTFYKKNKETGFREQKNGDLIDLPASPSTSTSDALTLIYSQNTIGYTHVHLDDVNTGEFNEQGLEKLKHKIRIHSPADVDALMEMANFQSATGNFVDLYGVMLSRDGTYVIKFTGTAAAIKTGFNTEEWNIKFGKYFKENDGRSNETNFLLFLKDKMQVNGISLYRVKANGSVFEVKLNEAGTKAISEKCSD